SIAAYREAYRRAGHPGDGEVYLRVPIHVGESDTAARREAEASIMQFLKTLGAQLEDTATRAGTRAIEQRAERGRALQTLTYADALRDKVIIGAAGFVTRRLAALTDSLGLNGVLAEVNCGGLIPHEQVLRSLKLICEHVMPTMRTRSR